MTGLAHSVFDKLDVLTVEREVLDSVVAAVCHRQERFFTPLIDKEAMRTTQLSGCVAHATNGPNKVTAEVVLVDKTGTVSIRDKEIPVGRESRVGGNIGHLVFVHTGFGGQSLFPDDLSVQVGLD